jgi:hypothetical protein
LDSVKEHALQLLMYNRFRNFKHPMPGMSTTFSQFVMFSNVNLSKPETSDIVSNPKQLETSNSSKLGGSGGRDFSSSQ